jgi:hypothetical protein
MDKLSKKLQTFPNYFVNHEFDSIPNMTKNKAKIIIDEGVPH